MFFLLLKNFRYSIIAFLAIFVLSSHFIPEAQAQGGVNSAINGLNRSASQAFDGNDQEGEPEGVFKDIPEAIGKIIGAALAFIGVLFFILMLYGGFTWMNARGNDADTKKARDIIEAAVIGLIVVLAAYALTAYVGGILFGSQ